MNRLNTRQFTLFNYVYLKVKRIIDIVLCIMLAVFVFPFSLGIALIHKLFYGGPMFYVQRRVGKWGKEFDLIKFRTMDPTAEIEGARFSGRNDPRITRLGKFMRRCRVDEIPQLINILKGEMSFIGPRPEREVFINALVSKIPDYKMRLWIKPGLTGWAQVKGDYAGNDIELHRQKLNYDLFYLKNSGLLMDLVIILKTIKVVLQLKGE